MKFKERHYKTSIFRLATLVSAIVWLTSCTDETGVETVVPDADDVAITVEATLDATTQTTPSRVSYLEEGIVDEGTYYLYFESNYKGGMASWSRAKVTFGHPEAPTSGFAVKENADGKVKELKWTEILNKSTLSFMLTNVDAKYVSSYTTSSNDPTVTLNTTGENISPYVMGPLDTVNGTNDLLGGQAVSPSYNAKVLKINLYHRMALARVNIKVYPADDNHIINLENAKVYITNLYPKVYRISAKTGSVNLYKQSNESPVNMEMVVPGEIKWHEIASVEDEENPYTIYSSVDFVLPPQTLLTGTSHPKLVVEIPMEDVTGSESHEGQIQTYSSDLPVVMFRDSEDESGDDLGAAFNLQFIAGNRLNITATINSPETELYFAPVKVESWVSKSSHNVSCDQAGIYTPDDFYKLIEKFQAEDYAGLEHFGYRMADGRFVFQFWGNMTLEKELIEASMTADIPFIFNFSGFRVTVDDNGNEQELTGNFGQTELVGIVTGKTMAPRVIKSAEDFIKVLGYLEDGEPQNALEHGYYYDYSDTWEFEITERFTVDIADIFGKLNPENVQSTINFNFNGNEMTIKFGDNRLYVLRHSGILNRFIRFSPGIIDASDFNFLVDMYKHYYPAYPDILKMFGTKNPEIDDDPWEFTFLNSMTIPGDNIFMQMIPRDGYPDYSIKTSNVTVTISSGEFTQAYNLNNNSTNAGYIYKFMSGTGAMTSYSNLTSLTNYYSQNNPISMWQYGYFDSSANKWVFTLDFSYSSSYLTYTNLFNKMIPDTSTGHEDFMFVITGNNSIRVSSVPSSTSTTYIVLQGEEGAQTLYDIVTGVYEPQ